MIILKLTDGLGNQMFQYAYARFIQKEYSEKKLYLDITKLGGKHVRNYGLHYFKLNENVIIPNRLVQYVSRLYVKILLNLFYRVLRISPKSEEGVRVFSKCGLYTNSDYYRYFSFTQTCLPVKFVRGFFQNEKYFESIKDDIRKEFQINTIPSNNWVSDIAHEIMENESVCVHIRRGDYSTNNRFNVCTESYYAKGIANVKEKYPNAFFYVFSNSPEDIEWIKNNYSLDGNVRYIDNGNTEIEDFYLMTRCHHFIISNSTFSWWAAYLSENKDKIIVAPRPWVNSDEYQDGIYCKGWRAIDT